MSNVSFFKPNKRSSGTFLKFSAIRFGKEEDISVIVNVVRQAAWRDGKGSFKENLNKEGQNVSVKLNMSECAEIVSVIDKIAAFSPPSTGFIARTINNDDCKFFRASFYHQTEGGNSAISFGPSKVEEGEIYPKGFWFSVTRDGNNRFATPLSFAEAYRIKAFFDWVHKSDFNLKKAINDSMRSDRAPSRSQQPEPEPEPDNRPDPKKARGEADDEDPFATAPSKVEVAKEEEEEFENPFDAND